MLNILLQSDKVERFKIPTLQLTQISKYQKIPVNENLDLENQPLPTSTSGDVKFHLRIYKNLPARLHLFPVDLWRNTFPILKKAVDIPQSS